MRPLITAFAVLIGLHPVLAVDRLHHASAAAALRIPDERDRTRDNPLTIQRPSASAVRTGWLITLDERSASNQTPLATAAAQVRSRIRVSVPQDDAEVFVQDEATEPTGTVRVLETPPLESGKTHELEVTVKWRPNNYTVMTRTKTVRFRAGDEVAVDLTIDDPHDRAEIRYVPTPAQIVTAMIELARVSRDDVVYEPGCGDARITIAAVGAGARKGVGIDIDPERVAESKANVKAANLEDKIDIRLGDALDIEDLSEATVVFLYMGEEFNRLLRPLLWKQLKVGARIVSHRFTMGDWKPDKTIGVAVDDSPDYELHLWTITRDIKETAEKN